jgi:hypothetical protein
MARLFSTLIWLACLVAKAVGSELPAIRSGLGNEVPVCITPSDLMKFVRTRNDRRDPPVRIHRRFADLASVYRRIGRCVQRAGGSCQGVRWDHAFFQMLVETNYLTFRAPDGSPGSVSQDDNNFAGIGATVAGEGGEKFSNMRTGVLAHLQHVLMYSGEHILHPVAQRTRTVESYVIARMRALGRPPTFADLATLWTGTDQDTYGDVIQGIAIRFADLYCPAAGARHPRKR